MSTKQKENKKFWQDHLAEESGLAVVVTDEDSTALSKSNNNSMCEILYSSEEFAPRCAEFCGKAFDWAHEAGETVGYQCYAGLNCLAVPFQSQEKPLVAIVGRAFVKAENYRQATERAMAGDWQKFPPTKFFDNILLSGSAQNLEKLARRIENLSEEDKNAVLKFANEAQQPEETAEPAETKNAENEENGEIGRLIEEFHQTTAQTTNVPEKFAKRNRGEAEESAAWRGLFGSLLSLSYKEACLSVLRFIAKRYELNDLAWLEQRENSLETVSAVGSLEHQPLLINMSASDKLLLEAAQKETALEMRERNGEDKAQIVSLFPIAVGDEVRSALVISDKTDGQTKLHIGRFMQGVASELEILRLREELARRVWLESAVQKFNESLKNIDSEDFWARLIQFSAEILRAERSSLLLFDEKSKTLAVKSATGEKADLLKTGTGEIGERVAQKVLRSGRPLVVQDTFAIALPPAPQEWSYKTDSFISYPLRLGERKIGVLNFTDKIGGEIYGAADLELLNNLVPQIAVAIDRAIIKDRSEEFEQRSITDALTGLPNRGYLDQRLDEEIKRWERTGEAVSFIMIDVDYFKAYNDAFSHPEGDKALKIVGHCLKETLRGADVAARYGGEEFSILLPRTTSAEAVIIAERIRQKVEKTEFPNRQVTISIGIASVSKDIKDAPALIQAADKALYKAKENGRNRIQRFEDLDEDNGEE